MPTYNYICLDCEDIFESFHSMSGSPEPCPSCQSANLKKVITTVAFKVQGGTESMANHGYTGRHRDLVKKRKGNKNYRDGHRSEVQTQEKMGLADWKAEQQMKSAQEQFEKMREEGMKMTTEEKEKLKEEYGIKRGKTKATDVKF